MIAATFAQGMVVGALMLLMAEIMVAIALITLLPPSQDDDEDPETKRFNAFERDYERERRRNERNNNN